MDNFWKNLALVLLIVSSVLCGIYIAFDNFESSVMMAFCAAINLVIYRLYSE